MTPEQLREAKEYLGVNNKELALALGLDNTSGPGAGQRTIRRWLAGTHPITGPASTAIRLMCRLKHMGQWEKPIVPRRRPEPKKEG